ncbi:MAG: cytochrome c, class I [Gammaproteobacteria bacterium]|nr:cytochrome c, class I [Gammaproteobacteria bacterium]
MNKLQLNTLVFTTMFFGMVIFPFINANAAESPNTFNRLFIPPSERNTTLESDGIHDPAVSGLKLLQQPATAFKPLVSTTGGNNVDWVKSQKKGLINPLYDHTDPDKKAMAMDLSIVIEVKASMPDVRFPHQEHTVILDCSNCHDAIFKPLKGSNPMSMAEIMLGQKCGVCHGSIAFPVTECRRCHSVDKAKKTNKKK